MSAQPQPLIVSGKASNGPPAETLPGQPVVYNARGLLLDGAQTPPAPIRWVRWANLQTGEYEAFRSDPAEVNRLAKCLRQAAFRALIYRGRSQLQWTPAVVVGQPTSPPAETPAPACPRVRGLPVAAVAARRCEGYACDRIAAWQTSEEVEVSPLVDAEGTPWERGRTVKVHYWCEQHYQLPRLIHPDGSSSKIEVEARP